MENQTKNSKITLWSGWILKGIIVLFLTFDGLMKIIRHEESLKGTIQLGLPENCIQFLGTYLVIGTILYLIPRTVVLGSLLLTAYLGGAVAIMYSAKLEGHPYIFPVVFAVVIWLAEYLRNEKVRELIPLTK